MYKNKCKLCNKWFSNVPRNFSIWEEVEKDLFLKKYAGDEGVYVSTFSKIFWMLTTSKNPVVSRRFTIIWFKYYTNRTKMPNKNSKQQHILFMHIQKHVLSWCRFGNSWSLHEAGMYFSKTNYNLENYLNKNKRIHYL